MPLKVLKTYKNKFFNYSSILKYFFNHNSILNFIKKNYNKVAPEIIITIIIIYILKGIHWLEENSIYIIIFLYVLNFPRIKMPFTFISCNLQVLREVHLPPITHSINRFSMSLRVGPVVPSLVVTPNYIYPPKKNQPYWFLEDLKFRTQPKMVELRPKHGTTKEMFFKSKILWQEEQLPRFEKQTNPIVYSQMSINDSHITWT